MEWVIGQSVEQKQFLHFLLINMKMKLINVIKPDAGLSDSKPDLPAKVPLPPRRQAMAGSTSVQ